MNQTVRSLSSRPFENVLLLLTIMFGVALFGLLLTIAWPGLKGEIFSMGMSTHELSIQSRETDSQPFYNTLNAPTVIFTGRVDDTPVIFKQSDLKSLKDQAPDVQAAYLSNSVYLGTVGQGKEMLGVTEDYFYALKPRIIVGTLPSVSDYRERRPVIVLTQYGAGSLFPKKSPLGKMVEGYKVIGVVEMSGADQAEFRSADQPKFGAMGFIPYGAEGTDGNASVFPQTISMLRFLPVVGRDAESIEQLSAAMQRRWGERVSLRSNAQAIDTYRRTARRNASILALMGLGGLLVASLNILALMLARVSARQRLLGMAAALGASRARLRSQFLMELFLLSFLGSLLGAGLASGVFWWLNHGLDTGQALPPQPWVLLGTALGATLLSTLFGLPPAIQASHMRPAEALRA